MDLITLNTGDVSGYNIQFSPFSQNLIAFVGGANFGLSGTGVLSVIDFRSQPTTTVIFTGHWPDALYDLSWSESNEDIIATGAGDGSLALWDLKQKQKPSPIAYSKEHSLEISAVRWSLIREQQLIATSSWDKTIKIWDPIQCETSLQTFLGHSDLIYDVRWSPFTRGRFASVSGDGTACIWDSRHPQSDLLPHGTEVLTCDWSKYDQNVLFTGGADAIIRVWDMRNSSQPLLRLDGHQLAVKNIESSPYNANVIASVSYDLTTRLWDTTRNLMCSKILENHTEFIYGLDFHLSEPLLGDCSWDKTINIYNINDASAGKL